MAIKSVHITNYYHKTSGGISTAYNKLLEAANRRGRHVRLIVPGEESSVEQVGDFGKIYYVKADFSPIFDKRYRLMLPWKTYIFDKSPIKTILRDERAEIIEIGEKYTLSLMAGLLRRYVMNVGKKRPMLVQFSCERMDDNVRSFISSGKVTNWLTRRYTANYTLPMFDFHLVNSQYTGEELYDAVCTGKNPRRSNMMFNMCWRFLRAPRVELKDRIFVNQCGVDNQNFDAGLRTAENRAGLISELGLSLDTRLLLYAGHISPEKNTDLLLEMMRSITANGGVDYHLLIAGGGPSSESFAEKAAKVVSGKITMLGHITDKIRLATLFANCDAFVHPNPHEPFGITPLEAMASGLPVVAPNAGGLLSYADDRNAWLAEPNGIDFAVAVESVFADEAVRRSRVEAGLATAARYDWVSSTDTLFELYDNMYAEFTEKPDLYDYAKPSEKVDFARVLTKC